MPDAPEAFITADELARILGVSRTTVWRMTREGMGSYVFAKRSRRFLASECVAWCRGRGSLQASGGAVVVPLRPRRVG
jgi:excisionase family DNA binding protein